MKVLVTGAGGFIGKNLIAELRKRGYKDEDLLLCYSNTSAQTLADYAKKCEFVFHLAGVNRPEKDEEFLAGNRDFTELLLDLIQNSNRGIIPFLMTSSIQATLDNPYGRSKRAAEQVLLDRAVKGQIRPYIYRLPNVFGKWCRPNYNSAVATFCYNIARDLPISVRDRDYTMQLAYIDDVTDSFINTMEATLGCNKLSLSKACSLSSEDVYCNVSPIYSASLGEIVDLLCSFKSIAVKTNYDVFSEHPQGLSPFEEKMYKTYLSYLSPD